MNRSDATEIILSDKGIENLEEFFLIIQPEDNENSYIIYGLQEFALEKLELFLEEHSDLINGEVINKIIEYYDEKIWRFENLIIGLWKIIVEKIPDRITNNNIDLIVENIGHHEGKIRRRTQFFWDILMSKTPKRLINKHIEEIIWKVKYLHGPEGKHVRAALRAVESISKYAPERVTEELIESVKSQTIDRMSGSSKRVIKTAQGI